jgi:hypothetical protein
MFFYRGHCHGEKVYTKTEKYDRRLALKRAVRLEGPDQFIDVTGQLIDGLFEC